MAYDSLLFLLHMASSLSSASENILSSQILQRSGEGGQKTLCYNCSKWQLHPYSFWMAGLRITLGFFLPHYKTNPLTNPFGSAFTEHILRILTFPTISSASILVQVNISSLLDYINHILTQSSLTLNPFSPAVHPGGWSDCLKIPF